MLPGARLPGCAARRAYRQARQARGRHVEHALQIRRLPHGDSLAAHAAALGLRRRTHGGAAGTASRVTTRCASCDEEGLNDALRSRVWHERIESRCCSTRCGDDWPAGAIVIFKGIRLPVPRPNTRRTLLQNNQGGLNVVHFVGAGSGAAGPHHRARRAASRRGGRGHLRGFAGESRRCLTLTKPGCEIHDSAKMTLEEVIAVIQAAESARARRRCACTRATPSIYGAVREQFDALDRAAASPLTSAPVSAAFCGAAAALRDGIYAARRRARRSSSRVRQGARRCRSGESIRALAAHRATMVLFLSTSLTEKLQGELLAGGYGDDNARGHRLQGDVAGGEDLPLHGRARCTRQRRKTA